MLSYPPMSKAPAGLADYVRQVMRDKDLTLVDIERQSGGAITNSYLSKILSGKARNLTMVRLEALARGLNVPLQFLLRVASGGVPEEDEEFRASLLYLLYEKSKTAGLEDKRLINELTRMLLDKLERRAS